MENSNKKMIELRAKIDWSGTIIKDFKTLVACTNANIDDCIFLKRFEDEINKNNALLKNLILERQ